MLNTISNTPNTSFIQRDTKVDKNRQGIYEELESSAKEFASSLQTIKYLQKISKN